MSQIKDRIILDLCGGTGAWSKPYTEAGYDVRVITLPEWDVREYVKYHDHDPGDIYGILAAPPCDHLSVSGAQYFKIKDADGRTEEALEIVDACIDLIVDLNPNWWALENPVGRLRGLRGHVLGDLSGTEDGAPTLIFDPCDYGDPYTKKTLLWGRFNLPIKQQVAPVRSCPQGSWLQRLGG